MRPKMKNKIIKGVITEIDWRYIKNPSSIVKYKSGYFSIKLTL